MDDISLLEESFNKFINNLSFWLPEGIIDVDIQVLRNLELLSFMSNKGSGEDSLTRYFQVVESDDKITLVNDQFVIWIVPDTINQVPTTFTLIAINVHDQPHLEVAFKTSGVYNTSRLVLRILERYLSEIQENEELIKTLKNAS
jgi:hypothetical protein